MVSNVITNEGCVYNETLCPFTSDIEIMQYYSKGINYSSLNMSYDFTFLACVNKFYKCMYMLSDNESTDYMNSGVKIGLGVDLSEYNESYWNEIEMPESVLDTVKQFFSKKGKDAEDLLLNQSKTDDLDYESVYEISVKHIEILLKYIQTNLVKGELDNTVFTTPLISVMLDTKKENSKVYNEIASGNIEHVGYFIMNSLTNMTSVKQTQSFAFTAMNTTCYKKTLVSFIIDSSMGKNEFNSTYNGDISSIINILPYEVSLIWSGQQSQNIFPFTTNKTYMDECVYNFAYPKDEQMHIEHAIKKAEDLFKKHLKDVSYYTMKIIILVINKKATETEEEILENINKYKEKGFGFIIIGNEQNANYYESILGTSSNIIYVKGFGENNHDNTTLPHYILSSICRQHIYLQLDKDINNLEIVSINEPHYFEVKLSSKKSKKYIIQLDIQNIQTSEYQIYVSTKNPFPNINEYDIKHLGNIHDLSHMKEIQPYLIVITDNIDTIFISVESTYLKYDITIKEYEKDNVLNNTSNGLYGTNDINVTIGPSSEYLSFENCYQKKCMVSNESLIKTFARGLSFYNTNDNRNEDETFLNSYLFSCLYSLYYCAYIDKDKGALIGHPNSLIISEKDPYILLNDYHIPELLINKIRPLFIKDKSNYNITLQQENVNFTMEETFTLYNVSFSKYIDSMNTSLRKDCSYVFKDLDINWRFILFMNKLSSDDDFNDSKKLVSTNETSNYLNWLFTIPNSISIRTEPFYQHIQNVLIHSLINNYEETCLISLIVGNSLVYTSHFAEFFENLIDYRLKQKISLTLLHEDSNKQERLFDFSKASDELKKKLNSYINTPHDNKKLSSQIDVNYVVKNEISRFETYDKGIKRVVLLIGDEHFQLDNTYINHELKIKDSKRFKEIKKELKHKHINIMLITSIAPDLNYHYKMNEYLNDFALEEIFPISNFSNILYSYQSIVKAIRHINVKIPKNYIIINDYFTNNSYYYEIEINNSTPETIVIQSNSHHMNIHYSFIYPYPNSYMNNGTCKNTQQCEIIIGNTNISNLYITFEPTKDISFFTAHICEWDTKNKKCKHVKEVPFITIIILLVSTLFLFVYGLVTCKKGDQRSTKKTNIFN